MNHTTPHVAQPPRPGQDIHVLHVVPVLQAGGMELAMARIIRGLDGMRHSVVCLSGQASPDVPLPASVPVYCMNSRPHDPLLPWRLGRLIRQLAPTVIHARNWSAWPDVALGRLLAKPPPPLVFSFHGFDTPGLPPLRRRLAFRVLGMMTTGVFTVSRATRDMLQETLGLTNVGIIANGVDTDRFAPATRDKPAGPLIIGSVGNLTAVKNHALLLRACATLVRQGLDLQVRIAGEGPQRPVLTQLAHELGLTSRVTLAGRQSDVPAFLNGLDVFVLPSLSEAHPNALLEAMACGLPCVAARVGGVSEVLEDHQAGLAVEAGNESALADAIVQLCRQRELTRTLSAAARQCACEHYSMSAMLAEYARLYGQFAAAPPAPATFPGRRPRVLVLGPTPPLTGGMVSVVEAMRQSNLAGEFQLDFINNGKLTPRDRPLVVGIVTQLRLLGQLARTIRRTRPDLVHIHTCSGRIFWRDCLHMLVARLLKRPAIWHIHGGYFGQFIAQMPATKRWLARTALERSAGAILVNDSWLSAARELAPRCRWRVVPNGVAIPPPVTRSSNGNARFLFLGNLGPAKGTHDLIDAAARAREKGWHGTIQLAGGETRQGQTQRLRQRAADAALRDQVHFLGVLGGEEKQAALAQADCLLLPSHAEALPMALLEAMAWGLPAIATDVGGIPKVLRHGIDGFLVKPGDVKDLADRMLQLADDSELRRAMGHSGRVRVGELFSIDVMSGNLSAVYREALTRKERP